MMIYQPFGSGPQVGVVANIPGPNQSFTVTELLDRGLTIAEAHHLVFDFPLEGCAMFSPIARCSYCTDEYDPVEYRTVPQDPDEVQFCSDSCEQKHWEAVEAEQAYWEAGAGSPVWP